MQNINKSCLKTYSTFSLTVPEIMYLGNLALQNPISTKAIKTVPGTVEDGGEYAEYHVDEDGLYELILDTFYTKTSDSSEEQKQNQQEETESTKPQTTEKKEETVHVDFKILH